MTELIVICCYLALLVLLGLFASRLFSGSKEDYQLASHSIGPFLLLMSLFGTTMTAFALVGSTGEAYSAGVGVYGLMASSSGIIHSLCFFLLGIRLWRLGSKYGYSTQVQFFRDRLGSDKIGLLLFPILVGLVVPYLLVGVISSGTVMQAMTAGAFPDLFPSKNPGIAGGIPPYIGMLMICGVVLVYVFFGGMRGTAWANAFQTAVFMVLGIVTFCVIANKLGGEGNLLANMQKLSAAVPPDKATRIAMSKTEFFTYLFVPFSVGMFPHLFQHWLTAKSAESFKLPVVAHPIFIMIVWVPCILIGIWATTDLMPTRPPLPKVPGTDIVNPNAILPFLVKTQTSALLGGFLAAGVLAAIMSSLDSQFLCLGTMFSTDIVNHYRKEPLSDRAQVFTTRAFIIGIVALTYLLSLSNTKSVFNLGVWSFSGFSSLFPLVFAALYWRGLTKAGAYAGILTAICMWCWQFAASDYGEIRDYTFDLTLGDAVYKMQPVAPIFLASAVALVVVSLVTPKPDAAVLRKFFPERA
ncbi:Sodium/proline symporter [Posidoniimonas polymericola]|uniref:Sodium/proline symporter n=1 Tax=Posidoniimonas polymericola TaxID=2528002 RepID=A0A5C5ZFE3_9BACT|nr:sodium:solute symporter family protein [Posidoniimonas polymericola]TWT85820.1 Sodium/proline symporter [Posidoniimonas polymericola]